MARVFLPPQLRDSARGVETLEGEFATVAEALAEMARRFPEAHRRLTRGDGQLASGWAVVVDGAAAPLGVRAMLAPGSEVHILPALGGG